MSRAFTREIDDAPAPPAPERPISTAPNFVTPEGAAQIAAQLAKLDAAIRRAGATGAVEELMRDQRYWAARQASMVVVPLPVNPRAVAFGTSAVILRRGKASTVRIVGEDEADPARGLLAWTSPLAQALEGAEAGETIAFEAGGRSEDITVRRIG